MNRPGDRESESRPGSAVSGFATDYSHTGVIIVDHGSRRQESNDLLLRSVIAFTSSSDYRIVEPAHMELAPPDIGTAFRRCVERGARRIVVFPWFLAPGRHWDQDIPQLVAAAASEFPRIPWLVTAPFGLHPGMLAIVSDRIARCLAQAADLTRDADSESDLRDPALPVCDFCEVASRCRFRTAAEDVGFTPRATSSARAADNCD